MTTYQARAVLEEITDTLVTRNRLIHWVLVLKLVSFFHLRYIRSDFLDHAVKDNREITLITSTACNNKKCTQKITNYLDQIVTGIDFPDIAR